MYLPNRHGEENVDFKQNNTVPYNLAGFQTKIKSAKEVKRESLQDPESANKVRHRL